MNNNYYNTKSIIEKIEDNNLEIIHAFCITILIMSFIYSILIMNIFYLIVTLIGIFYFFSALHLIMYCNYQKIKNMNFSITVQKERKINNDDN
jgi:c-di-AMP phosphodiesterase-like protein